MQAGLRASIVRKTGSEWGLDRWVFNKHGVLTDNDDAAFTAYLAAHPALLK